MTLWPWTGSWTGAPDNPSVVSAVSAMVCVICAGRTLGAWGRASCKRQVIDSDLDGSQQARLAFFVVAQRDKRDIVISSNNYRSPTRRGG